MNNHHHSTLPVEYARHAGRPNVSAPLHQRAHWFERRIIDHLDGFWHGPAIALTVENRHYRLGAGSPSAQVILHKASLLRGLWHSPSMAFGEGYMNGDIDVTGSLQNVMNAAHATVPEDHNPWYDRLMLAIRGLRPRITGRRARANARHHYNIGNEFYKLWLDPSLTYSCAYFKTGADTLEAAQFQKLDLVCRKARIEPGQTVLDIGCGWGSLVMHAAKHFNCNCVGITAADDQAAYIESLAEREGLSDRIKIIKGDWRELSGTTFDRIVSVGMFEHVGRRQYAEFFRKWRELLADGGLSVLHTIGRMHPAAFDPWIDKYIFPGGDLPTLESLAHHAAKTGLQVVDVENLKRHYAKTLGHWIKNFEDVTDEVSESMGERFVRMWRVYLNGSRAGFESGDLQLWQVVLAKDHDHPWPLDRSVVQFTETAPPPTG